MIVRLFSDNDAIRTTEIWNPDTKQWSVAAEHQVPRTYHSVGLLLKTGEVLGGGGGLCGGCNVNHADFEIFSPPYLFNADGSRATRPVIERSPASFRPGRIIPVKMDSGGPHTFALVRLSAATHAVNNDMRRVPLRVVTSSPRGLFRLKSSFNPAVVPPGDYFLFAMNSEGVPSIAATIRADKKLQYRRLPVAVAPRKSECARPSNRVIYHLISRETPSKGLNVEGSSRTAGANVEQRTVGAGRSDDWRIRYVPGGYVRLIAWHSKQALAVENSSSAQGASIVQVPQSVDSENLDWCLMDVGDGYYKIKSRSSGLVVDVNGRSMADGTNIIQWSDNGQPNQQWKLETVRNL